MRNYGMFFSALAFSILFFTGVVSFWVTDPLLYKICFFTFGILAAVSTYLVCLGLPSEADKVREENNRNEEYVRLWDRIDGVETSFYRELNDTESRCDNRINNVWDEVSSMQETKRK